MLDADLATLYQIETKNLNKGVQRNKIRFPEDFMFQLTNEESDNLRSQIATASTPGIRLQIAPASKRNVRFLPYAFTEHGALQAANILNSERAVAMSVYVIRAFVRMRDEIAANSSLEKRLVVIEKTLLSHDAALRDVIQKIRPLLLPPSEPLRKKIGFHSKD